MGSLSFIEKENSSYCEDKGSLKINNGENQESYKNDSSCAKVSSSLTTTKDLEVAVIPKMSNPTSLLGNISTKSEKKAQQSDSFLNFNSTDALDSQGSSSSISNDNEIIDLDIKRRKENEIKNNKDISLKEKSNEYKSVTCKNEKSKRLISYSSTIIPLGTHVEPKQTQEQSIAQTHKLSKTQVQKQVTSTESSSEDDDDKRRGNDSNSESLISSNDTSIAIPNVKVTPSKSTVIESSSSSFIEKENSSYCEDKGSLKIDNGENQDSYKNDSSCAKVSSSLTTTKDLEVAVIPKMSNPTSLLGNISTKSEKKAQQSDSFLNFNSTDALDSQGSSSSISNDNEIIDLDIRRRKENEIKNNKDISLKE